jgi:fermentation-respiration switch protein FrsA (DUF1100 family)
MVLRRGLGLSFAALAGFAIVCGANWIVRAFLFHPDSGPEDERIAERTEGLERLHIESDEGPVEAFFVPGEGVSPERPGPALVYAHGNSELIDRLPEWLRHYRAMGVSVLMPEYRGYGRSAGAPSERAFREDFVAFYDLLAQRRDVDRTRIAFHGVSLGGGAVSQLAHRRPPAALILQSTFSSIADAAWEGFRAPRILLADPFDSIGALHGVRAPVLILHGTRDEVVPFAHAERLHRAIPQSRLISCDAGHGDLPPPELDYWGEIERFLREARVLR